MMLIDQKATGLPEPKMSYNLALLASSAGLGSDWCDYMISKKDVVFVYTPSIQDTIPTCTLSLAHRWLMSQGYFIDVYPSYDGFYYKVTEGRLRVVIANHSTPMVTYDEALTDALADTFNYIINRKRTNKNDKDVDNKNNTKKERESSK